MTTTPQSMSDDELPVPAFRLTWRGGAYYVSEPSIGNTDCYTAEQLHAVRVQAFHDGQVAGRATAEQAACSCPSGDGSLRWPCAVHPAEQTGKVEGCKDCDGSGWDEDGGRAVPSSTCRGDGLAKPTQPAAPVVSHALEATAVVSHEQAICETQAATKQPVAWQFRCKGNQYGEYNWQDMSQEDHDSHSRNPGYTRNYEYRELFAAPVSPSREVEALVRDAARYRFLRSAYVGEDGYLHPSQWDIVAQERSRGTLLYGASLDYAIDSKLAPVQEKAP